MTLRTLARTLTPQAWAVSAAQCLAKGVEARFAQPAAAKVTWLNDPFASPHAADPVDGLSRALDATPLPVNWTNFKAFDAMAAAVFAASAELGIPIRWGADWDRDGHPRERGESDSPHFELGR